MSDPVLLVDGISKRFGAIQALQDVSMSISRGQIVGLVGDNGAGKSTLVKIIAGVHQATSGRVLLDGEPVAFTSPAEARDAGIETVYQHLALVDNLDVAANFYLGRELFRGRLLRWLGAIDKAEMRRRSREAIDDLHVRIPGEATRLVRDMSGGQRQAVAIARSAFWKTRLLLLDEPTAALGVEETAEVERLIHEMRDGEGVPMLIISHDMPQIVRLCDEVVVLRQGRKVAHLSGEDTTAPEIVAYLTGAKV